MQRGHRTVTAPTFSCRRDRAFWASAAMAGAVGTPQPPPAPAGPLPTSPSPGQQRSDSPTVTVVGSLDPPGNGSWQPEARGTHPAGGNCCFIKQQLKRVQRPGEGARLPPHAGSSGRCRQDADTELGSPRRQQPPPLGIRGAGESGEEPPAGQTERLQLGFVCPRRPQRPSCRTETAARRGTSPTEIFTLRPGPQQRWCRGEIVSVVFGEKRRAAPQPELNAARTDRQHQPLLAAAGKRRGGGERWLGGEDVFYK